MSEHRPLSRRSISGVVVLVLLHTTPLRPADIPVTGSCNLAEAIHAANSDTDRQGRCPPGGSGDDTLTLSGDVVLSAVDNANSGPTGLPVITTTVIVDGTGHTIERASAAPEFRFFWVFNALLTLKNVTLRNGRVTEGSGGAIGSIYGAVRLDNVTLTGNVAKTGGAIFANTYGPEAVTVRNSRIADNLATSVGGAIAGWGGRVTIDHSDVVNNHAERGGGGIRGDGTLEQRMSVAITRSLIRGNSSGQSGGGIDAAHPYVDLEIDHSLIADNRAASYGGAVHSVAGVVVRDSAIVANEAGIGGGLHIIYGFSELSLESSLVAFNVADQAGGGMSVSRGATAEVVNSSISHNVALSYGGGIDNHESSVTVANATVSANTSPEGAGIHGSVLSSTHATGSILAANVQGANCQGPLSHGAGVFDDDGSCGSAMPIIADVDFETELADNGGPTLTHALLPGSVAIDGAGACGLEFDQRGYRRDTACDSGAHEFGAVPCAAICAAGKLLVGRLADLRADASCREAVCHDTGGATPLGYLGGLPELTSGEGHYYFDPDR